MSSNNYSKSKKNYLSGESGGMYYGPDRDSFSRRDAGENCWADVSWSMSSGPSRRRHQDDDVRGTRTQHSGPQPEVVGIGPLSDTSKFCGNETSQHTQINDIVFIVPREFPEIKLTLQDSSDIVNVLQDELFRLCKSPCIAPSFEEHRFIDGALRFTCSDLHSLQWLIKVIRMCPWRNPSLDVRNLLSMPGLFSLGLVISGNWPGDIDFLIILEKQNPGLGAGRWQVTHRKPDHAGWRVLVATDKEGVNLVKARLGKLYWGLGTIKVVMLGGTDRNYPSGPVWKMYPDVPKIRGPDEPGSAGQDDWPQDVDSVEGWEMALSVGQWIQ